MTCANDILVVIGGDDAVTFNLSQDGQPFDSAWWSGVTRVVVKLADGTLDSQSQSSDVDWSSGKIVARLGRASGLTKTGYHTPRLTVYRADAPNGLRAWQGLSRVRIEAP